MQTTGSVQDTHRSSLFYTGFESGWADPGMYAFVVEMFFGSGGCIVMLYDDLIVP